MSRRFAQAYVTLGHGFSRPTLITLMIGLLCYLTPNLAADDDAVVLPVEFYLGRWAEGATAQGTGFFEEGRRPSWMIAGSYANDLLRVGGATDFKPSTQFVEQSSAFGYAMFRPGTRYQFAVDELSYETYEFAMPGGPSHMYKQTFLRASGRHYNTDFVHLSDIWSQYQYAGGAAFGKGEMMVRVGFEHQRDTEDSDHGDRSIPSSRDLRDLQWIASGLVSYGLSSSMVVEAGLAVSDSNFEDEAAFSWGLPEDTTVVTKDSGRNYSFEAAGTFLIGSGAVVRVFAGQTMAAYNRQDVTVVLYPDSLVFRPLVETAVPLRSSERKIGGTISLLSRGAFDPNILLDDYLGYYKGLLFEGQKRVVAGVEYMARPDEKPFGYDEGTIYADAARGFGGGLEASATVQYEWWRGRYRSFVGPPGGYEEISWRLGIRWRSYSYQPGVGPGWDRDSDADIAFGPMLRPGDLYLAITCAPPGLATRSSSGGGGFLSFHSLEGSGTLGLRLQGEAGLGYNTNLLAEARILFGSDAVSFSDDRLNLRTGIRIRFLSGVEARAEYEQSYAARYHDPAQVTFNLAGIF